MEFSGFDVDAVVVFCFLVFLFFVLFCFFRVFFLLLFSNNKDFRRFLKTNILNHYQEFEISLLQIQHDCLFCSVVRFFLFTLVTKQRAHVEFFAEIFLQLL